MFDCHGGAWVKLGDETSLSDAVRDFSVSFVTVSLLCVFA